ncbi:coiled-coil domain-containing protein 69-like [Gambusia affinis]|uniref:coiled-coil domain-containing protein 69-like n=1 Tax=Gambusia affinis TaxID=33528 RepID=UPI001CDB89BC|nr:coiled-coil domain-containing protein 69-like [Gambusia affinis]
MTPPKNPHSCPLCGNTFSFLGSHLVNFHKIKNIKEKQLLLSLASGRICIRKMSCPVEACNYAQSRLDKHLQCAHPELSREDVKDMTETLKRQAGINGLRALRATNPTPPLVSSLDVEPQEWDEQVIRRSAAAGSSTGEKELRVGGGLGCSHKKTRRGKKRQKDSSHQAAEHPSSDVTVALERQLECFEEQVTILKEVLSASGSSERVELLRGHADKEVCALVLSLLDKVVTETELNFLDEHKKLQSKHEKQVADLTQRFQAEQETLKDKLRQFAADLQAFNDLKIRVEDSTFKKNLELNIMEHGSPGAFWEAEQESLISVIEMKGERLQEQSRKLERMDQLVERNVSLEAQIVQVLQQNKDLEVQIESFHTLIQQFLKEQQDLKVALETQRAVNENLKQEKEQLILQLRDKDSCPGTHL